MSSIVKRNTSRRKTLSHAEIEDFLCDLHQDNNVPTTTATETVSVSTKNLTHCENEDQCDPLFGKQQQKQQQQEYLEFIAIEQETLLTVENSGVDKTMDFLPLNNRQVDEPKEMHLVRSYVKSLFQNSNNSNQVIHKQSDNNLTFLCEQAKMIKELTNYIILPSYTISPETYSHPPNTLDGKKALLLSMSPMLNSAETQRKIDSDKCQVSTGCKVMKAGTRNANFEYYDVTRCVIIEDSEYEKR